MNFDNFISNHPYLFALFTGMMTLATKCFFDYFTKVTADESTDIRRNEDKKEKLKKNFIACKKTMPELFEEMKNDLEKVPLAREFIALVVDCQKEAYGGGKLNYFNINHQNLRNKIIFLANHKLINIVSDRGHALNCMMNNDFVDFLLEDAL